MSCYGAYAQRYEVEPPTLAEIRAALREATRIESLTGSPQDVEWAWADGTLWIVQARPITTTGRDGGDGFDSPPSDADLTTAGIGEMLPGVLPPLLWEVNSHLVDEALGHLDALCAQRRGARGDRQGGGGFDGLYSGGQLTETTSAPSVITVAIFA